MTPDKDEQDLVKALDDVADAAASVGGVPALGTSPTATATVEPPTIGAVASPFPPITSIPDGDSASSSASASPNPAPEPVSSLPVPDNVKPVDDDVADRSTPAVDAGPLESIKKDALVELRPLVDKLNVSPEEKFDTYLLLIRSTDDTDLIAPAHEAAKAIEDEARRAEALLDIIKEIDYLSNHKNGEA